MQLEVEAFIEECGSFNRSVHAAMTFSRSCWRLFSSEQAILSNEKIDVYRREIPLPVLSEIFFSISEDSNSERSFHAMLKRVLELKLGWMQNDSLTLRHSVVNPLDLLRLILRGARPDHEIRYSVMRDIRRFYDCVQSSATAHHFQVLSVAVNDLISGRLAQTGKKSKTITWDISGELRPAFATVRYQGGAISPKVSELFLECCRAVDYIRLSKKIGFVEFVTSNADAEYLLSRLFGLPTGIKGLDDLFGGGGIMLVEASNTPVRDRIGGRAVVTVGQFGSAKSLLSLQMAAEVARKGGIAWVMPLEQTAEDCLYTLESMGCLRDDPPLRVAITVSEALDFLEQPPQERGALILLRTVKENFEDFLAAFEENVRLMKHYPLRLIVVDPVSAFTHHSGGPTEKRARILQLFEDVKRSGTNIWLVTEEAVQFGETFYEQNTADTVIRLSSDNRHGYSQRHIEIIKSRLQREQRGKHAFAIIPGKGITVHPSPAAVRSRMQMRLERAPEVSISFGLTSLNHILGDRGLYAGDLIVLQGPEGCFKTPVGMSFLLGSDWARENRAVERQRPLLVSARDDKATIRHALDHLSHALRQQEEALVVRSPENIRIIAIGGGYVKPGYILQQIEDEFLQSRLDDRPIGRVMIDNIGHWELSCPYIREEETFADTLIDVLRRHRVTTVITCSEPSRQADSSLQQSVLDHADCLIRFERIVFRGTSRVMIRVVKTRDMTHRRESFELVATPSTLQIKTASSLLQVGSGGKVTPVEVRLFLHAESHAQTAYNKTILKTVRSILTRQTHLESQTFIHSSHALSLGSASAIDELQILQFDEFQLPLTPPDGKSMEGHLHSFHQSAWSDSQWEDTIPRLRNRVRSGDGYTAVPFYGNIGLLAYRDDLPQDCVESWEKLSRECERWEMQNRESQDVFFDFPMVSSENYSVMFLEILLWLAGPPPEASNTQQAECILKKWLTSQGAIEANLIMHRLCRRAFNYRHEAGSEDLYQSTPFRVNTRARVWRHWYSTLHQMFSEMLPAERCEIAVTPLPGGISVAGEWFLGVPRYSAAPDVGLKIIQLYTSREAELDRLKYGVGLPVRSSFYRSQENHLTSVSPFFSIDGGVLLQVLENAFLRSSFGCYRNYAGMLSTHLQSILMLSMDNEKGLETEIRARVSRFGDRLAFAESAKCNRCFLARSRRA